MTGSLDPVQPSAREAASKIVAILRDAGHVAYFAGGCVRDSLLGRTPKDYDVATDALPERVRSLFRNSKYVGEAFGVVLVRLLSHEIEVATFRVEAGYQDGRHPTQVEFTDARNDAIRRDFTINGMFEDPLASDDSGRIIDYVGGREDLGLKLIRAIGDPDDRFAEDYLRMLRAVRFAARLGFEIEDRTARAIRIHARFLGQISRERIGAEVQTMMSHPNRAGAARLCQSLHLDGPALAEEHSLRENPTLASLPPGASYPVALAAWLLDRHFVGEPIVPGPTSREDPKLVIARHFDDFFQRRGEGLVRRWRNALVLSNDHRAQFAGTLLLSSKFLYWQILPVAARKRLLAHERAGDATLLIRAFSHQPILSLLSQEIDADAPGLFADGVNPSPYITGEDLIALGQKPGPHFKGLLDDVYDAQLEHRVDSRENAMEWLRQRIRAM